MPVPKIINNPQYLLLRTCKGIEVIDVKNIIRIEAISNYSKLHFTNSKTLVVAKVMRWMEEQLPPRQFIRIHRTHIVNKNFIHRYRNGKISKIELMNGVCLDVSKRKKTFFLKALGNG